MSVLCANMDLTKDMILNSTENLCFRKYRLPSKYDPNCMWHLIGSPEKSNWSADNFLLSNVFSMGVLRSLVLSIVVPNCGLKAGLGISESLCVSQAVGNSQFNTQLFLSWAKASLGLEGGGTNIDGQVIVYWIS